MDDRTPQERLLQKIETTSECRFAAAERLDARDKSITFVNAGATIAVIAASVLPLALHISNDMTSYITLGAIISSIALLATSLLQYSFKDSVGASLHRRCARELNGLAREMEFSDVDSVSIVREFNYKYNQILLAYELNHTRQDFLRVKERAAAKARRDREEKTGREQSVLSIIARSFKSILEEDSPLRGKIGYASVAYIGVVLALSPVVIAIREIRSQQRIERAISDDLVSQRLMQKPHLELTVSNVQFKDLTANMMLMIRNSGMSAADNVSLDLDTPVIMDPALSIGERMKSVGRISSIGQKETYGTVLSFPISKNEYDIISSGKLINISGSINYQDILGVKASVPFCRTLRLSASNDLSSQEPCAAKVADHS